MPDLAIAIPTLVGSVLSMFASGFIFICYLVLPPRRHFRHTLILNLAAADFFNSTNNTISGIYALSHGPIPAGAACSLNGWIGQVTVQGTDFAILFISVATVITLRKWNCQPEMTRSKKIFISSSIWLVPLITSFTGLTLNDYKPVSGNWCWLDSEKPGLRYALGHGWRIAIIFIVIILYSYLFIYMHHHFAAQRHIAKLNEGLNTVRIEHWSDSMSIVDEELQEIRRNIYVHDEFEVSEVDNGRYVRREPEGRPWYEDNEYFANFETHPKDIAKAKIKDKEPTAPFSPYFNITQTFHPHGSQLTHNPTSRRAKETSPLLTRDPLALIRRPPPTLVTTTISPTYYPPTAITSRECHIQKLLILNAYPIGYVVLWIPGIANRFAELTGHQSRFLSIAQASTQFVGLANALVYGYNERIWSLASLWLAEKLKSKETAEFDNTEKMEISWPLGPPTAIYKK